MATIDDRTLERIINAKVDSVLAETINDLEATIERLVVVTQSMERMAEQLAELVVPV